MSTAPAATTELDALRPWQRKAVLGMREWTLGTYLIAAAPGAGKTRPSLHFAREELAAGRIKRVVVVCPTAPLTRQWAQAAAENGLQLLPDSPHLEPPSGFHGVSVTYARAAASAKRWRSICRPDTLIIADEAHHLGEELSWGDGFIHAFTPARRWLLLSGTPFRSDRTPIPGADYDADGYVVPDISYNYGEAVRDRVCRPIRFIPFDGMLQWVSGDQVVEGSFADQLSGAESARRYRTAISTELADGLPRILAQAAERLARLRRHEHPDAGGLVVAADAEHAARVAKILREQGEDPLTVVHTDPQAHKKLADFRRDDRAWIVAVNMVSEGVDIPRLRVGVYAAAAKTPLIFRQVVGRFVRVIPGRPPTDMSWMYLPADSRLRQHATDVEGDLRHVLLPADEENAEALDEPEERRRGEPGERLEFTPVMADVEAQLDLFAGVGGGGVAGDEPADAHAGFTAGAQSAAAEASGEAGQEAPAPQEQVDRGAPPLPATVAEQDPLDPWAALDDDEDDDEDSAPARSWQRAKPKRKDPAPVAAAERPAWEQQEQLRKRRHLLVSELARSAKVPQAAINAEINQAIGVGKVDQASNQQLEQSIQLLLDRLARRR